MSIGVLKGRDWNADIPQGVIDAVVFVGRALMAYIFIVEGYGKIVNYSGVAGYMTDHGVPAFLLPLVIVTELGGGLMILGGLMTRWAAIALAGFAILTAVIFHGDGADADQIIEFQKDLAIAGGFLILAALGPGAWSIDGWRAEAKARGPASLSTN
jgi:putative oxidoreductase